MGCSFCGTGNADERPFWCYKQAELRPGTAIVALHEFSLAMCEACVTDQSEQLRGMRRKQRRALFTHIWPILVPIVVLIVFLVMRIGSANEPLMKVLGRAIFLGALLGTGFILLVAAGLTVTTTNTVVNRELWSYAAEKQPGFEGFKGFWFEKPTNIRIRGFGQ